MQTDGRPPSGEAGTPGAFGERMAHYFHLGSAPTLSTTSFDSGQLSATWLYRQGRQRWATRPIPPEDGFICELYLAPDQYREVWSRDRLVTQHTYDKHSVGIIDLRDESRVCIDGTLDSISFRFPKSVLDEFTDDIGAARVGELACQQGVLDPVLASLGAAVLPALQGASEGSMLFFDQLALAINAHVLQRYGGLHVRRSVPAGGLSPYKERRAKELLASRLRENISISEVATACGLSRTYFISAFRHSTGVTPHKWLQRHKVEKSKEMLASTSSPIAEVAALCGFADQSHLTRTFARFVGMAPAAWRRECCAPRSYAVC